MKCPYKEYFPINLDYCNKYSFNQTEEDCKKCGIYKNNMELALYYLNRASYKGKSIKDLQKAKHCIEKELRRQEKENG